jgi:hypothetical protein
MTTRQSSAAKTAESRADAQVEFATKVAHDKKARAAFLANPEGFAKQSRVTLDPKFSTSLQKELGRVDREIATFENKFGRVGIGKGGVVMNAAAVAAGAAVVSAAAAVVSAAVAVYNTTKFRSPVLDKGVISRPVGTKIR